MAITAGDPAKPVGDLTAKTHSEMPGVIMEAADLPEFYRDHVAKNLCIISPAKAAEKTAGGIILAEKTKEATEYASQIGRIEAVGPFFYNKKRFGEEADNAPQVGDFVMFEPYVGRRFEVGGDLFLLIADDQIMIKKLDPRDDFHLYT